MSINHVLLLLLFCEQKHNTIKPQHLLCMSNKNTVQKTHHGAQIAGPPNTRLIHSRETSELRLDSELRPDSVAQL